MAEEPKEVDKMSDEELKNLKELKKKNLKNPLSKEELNALRTLEEKVEKVSGPILKKLNALRKEALRLYSQKWKKVIDTAYLSSVVGEEGKIQLINLVSQIETWVHRPLDDGEKGRSLVYNQYHRALQHGMSMDEGEGRESYFNELATLTKCIGRKNTPDFHALPLADSSRIVTLLALPYLSLSDAHLLDPTRKMNPPHVGENWMGKSRWSRVRNYFGWQDLFEKGRAGRKSSKDEKSKD